MEQNKTGSVVKKEKGKLSQVFAGEGAYRVDPCKTTIKYRENFTIPSVPIFLQYKKYVKTDI